MIIFITDFIRSREWCINNSVAYTERCENVIWDTKMIRHISHDNAVTEYFHW